MKEKGDKSNPFCVPDGYFEELATRTMFMRQISESADTGMEVPSGYFTQLQQDIETKISEENVKQLVPTADTGFYAPEGYFEELSTRLKSKNTDQKRGLIRRIIKPAAFRYVAAALVLLFSVLFIQDRITSNYNSLSDISDQELIQYLQYYGGTGDALIISENISLQQFTNDPVSELNAEDIEWYLENTW